MENTVLYLILMFFFASCLNSKFLMKNIKDGCPLDQPLIELSKYPDWTCFDDRWKLHTPGNGLISFYTQQNNWNLGIFNDKFGIYEYQISYKGWNNTNSGIKDKEGNKIHWCDTKHNVNTTDKFHYEVIFNGEENNIMVLNDGYILLACTDFKHYRAKNATYFSLSCNCNEPLDEKVYIYNVTTIDYKPTNKKPVINDNSTNPNSTDEKNNTNTDKIIIDNLPDKKCHIV